MSAREPLPLCLPTPPPTPALDLNGIPAKIDVFGIEKCNPISLRRRSSSSSAYKRDKQSPSSSKFTCVSGASTLSGSDSVITPSKLARARPVPRRNQPRQLLNHKVASWLFPHQNEYWDMKVDVVCELKYRLGLEDGLFKDIAQKAVPSKRETMPASVVPQMQTRPNTFADEIKARANLTIGLPAAPAATNRRLSGSDWYKELIQSTQKPILEPSRADRPGTRFRYSL
ncbi:hypothetical protein K474DRAFT_1707101 [Panus rudis PR-1116 ss-1]|nr:hypothetical protein K474DRAFT_1707101 [Panus rudis PR-1116 ss-1]